MRFRFLFTMRWVSGQTVVGGKECAAGVDHKTPCSVSIPKQGGEPPVSLSRVPCSISSRLRVWLPLFLAVLGIQACEPPTPRFDVPAYDKIQNPHQDLYRIKSKITLPRADRLPRWSSLADLQKATPFRPSVVQLQGQTWLQAPSGSLFIIYFQQSNMQAGQFVARVAEQVARFVQLWLEVPFDEQIHLLLSPQYRSVSAQTPTSLPTATQIPSSLPTSVPAPSVVPIVTKRQWVIRTGPDHDEKLSEYGLVAELTQGLMRRLLTQSFQPQPQQFWPSVAIPAYFDLRGTGALVSNSYDRSTFPKFREILQQSGFPTPQHIALMIPAIQRGEMPAVVQKRAIRVICSFLGFLEDAYGNRVMAALLRYVVKHPQAAWPDALLAILGKTEQELWSEWKLYYDPQAWRRLWFYQP